MTRSAGVGLVHGAVCAGRGGVVAIRSCNSRALAAIGIGASGRARALSVGCPCIRGTRRSGAGGTGARGARRRAGASRTGRTRPARARTAASTLSEG